MRILFLNPPFIKGFNREVRWQEKSKICVFHPPLLLAYAAAVARNHNHKVEVIDAPPLGLTVDETLLEVKKFHPDIVVAETSTSSIINDCEIVKTIKDIIGCFTGLVGPHVTALDKNTLDRFEGIDVIARQEYDYTITELANAIEDNRSLSTISGLTFCDHGKIIRTPNRQPIMNLDELPFPARDLLPNEIYFDGVYINPFTFMLCGRGCPFQCTFCVFPQVVFGHRYRIRSAGNVVNEMERIKEDFPHIRSIHFNDDTLTANREHTVSICKEILDRKLDISWSCYSRVDTIDSEMLAWMKRAGCHLIKYGIENGDDQVLRNMRKGGKATVKQARKTIKLTKNEGIKTFSAFVLGMPGETIETMEKTVRLAVELDSDYVQFSIAIPFPGTEFYREMKQLGYLCFEDWSDYLGADGRANVVFNYPYLSGKKILRFQKLAWQKYYLRPKFVIKTLKKSLTSLEQFKRSVKASWGLLLYLLS